MKTNFLNVLRARFIYIVLFLIVLFNQGNAQDSSIFTHGPYLQNVTNHSATIIFTTDRMIVPGVMIKSGNKPYELVQNSHEGLIDVGDNIHKIYIENLGEGQEYEYKLFACEIKEYRPYKCTFGDTIISKSFKFKTFKKGTEELKFTVFCDVHDRANKLGKYLSNNDIDSQDCYFLNGDIMGHIEEEAQLYSSFLDTCVSRFASEKPFIYVRGNHETRGKFARQLKDYLNFPDDKYYFAQTIGIVRFIVLDGGEDKPDSSKEYSGLTDFDSFRNEELQWLKNEVASDAFKTANYKIVIIHMPIIKNKKNWYGMQVLAEQFGPVLKEAKIDLMISGHLHRNQWINADNSGFDYPVMISSNNHFIEASVNENEISLVLKDMEGNVEKQYEVKSMR